MPVPDWRVEGDLFEGCNCHSLCPCHVSFRQPSTNPTCENIWAVHIDRGVYGVIGLNDLNALVIVLCPGPTMYDGNWVALLYIDDNATAEQEEALVSILSGAGGGPWAVIARWYAGGAYRVIQRASFQFTKERRSRGLRVANVASLEVEATRGADADQEIKITNLRNIIHGPEHILAQSNHQVEAGGLKWDNRGKHGLYSYFRWSGP